MGQEMMHVSGCVSTRRTQRDLSNNMENLDFEQTAAKNREGYFYSEENSFMISLRKVILAYLTFIIDGQFDANASKVGRKIRDILTR